MTKGAKNIHSEFQHQQTRIRRATQTAVITAMGTGIMGGRIIFANGDLSPLAMHSLMTGTVICGIAAIIAIGKAEKANKELRKLFYKKNSKQK